MPKRGKQNLEKDFALERLFKSLGIAKYLPLGFTVERLSEALGISDSAIYNSIGNKAARQLPNFPQPYYIGRKPFFRLDDVMKYIEGLPRESSRGGRNG